jgi:hypothetical protein
MMICSICRQPLSMKNCHSIFSVRYGNNAQPVNDGICCDTCNWTVVIKARLAEVAAAVLDETSKKPPQ